MTVKKTKPATKESLKKKTAAKNNTKAQSQPPLKKKKVIKKKTVAKKRLLLRNRYSKAELTEEERKRRNNLLMLITFFSGVVLIISTYAWLSVSVNVKIKSLNLLVSSDSGLFISLDGVNFSDTVEISSDSVITDLKDIYSSNTNQWAGGGLWPVSTNGIPNSSTDKFSIFSGQVSRFKNKVTNRRYLNTVAVKETASSGANAYIAFDVFLKNVSGSPTNDNLYLDDGTSINIADDTTEDDKNAMSGVMNSMRFGFVKVGTVSNKADTNTIQNIQCNNDCQMVLYEPNSTLHSETSITKAKEYGVTLVDGIYSPSYAITAEGKGLEYANGQEGTGLALDAEHFALQNTIKDFSASIFSLPNGITKLRVYIWIEGQDIDSLETSSRGANVDIAINFVKDLAGYE